MKLFLSELKKRINCPFLQAQKEFNYSKKREKRISDGTNKKNLVEILKELCERFKTSIIWKESMSLEEKYEMLLGLVLDIVRCYVQTSVQ